jgi:type I restriction enzyme, R subunit
VPDISERSFEDTIEAGLLQGGPDAPVGSPGAVHLASGTYEDMVPGRYRKRLPEAYDRGLCLIPRDVLDFIYATQPKDWERLEKQHGLEVKERFLKRISSEIKKRGVLDVLRKGVKDSRPPRTSFMRFWPRVCSGAMNYQRRIQEIFEEN